MKKIAVLGSGKGSNFQAIVEYFSGKDVDITCISNQKDAFILERAKMLNIKCFYIPHENLEDFFKQNHFDLIALAGYMRIIPENTLQYGDFINIHPAYSDEYKGLNAIKRAFENKEKYTGVTIHRVSKDVDSGKILVRQRITILEDDTLETLTQRVHKMEHLIYPQIIEHLLNKVGKTQ